MHWLWYPFISLKTPNLDDSNSSSIVSKDADSIEVRVQRTSHWERHHVLLTALFLSQIPGVPLTGRCVVSAYAGIDTKQLQPSRL
jgi:hypothetical protein